MMLSLATRFDAMSDWRTTLAARLDDLARFLGDRELIDQAGVGRLAELRERLRQPKLVVAFVAEFSRGKSELINAIFFADTGRRVLPATPGRTTMCPVELGWDREESTGLRLLPIETRLEGRSLADLRHEPRAWSQRPLPMVDPAALAEALAEVSRTRFVSTAEASDLGFWDDARADDNPPLDAQGRVQIPVWRHALINYPHPLLKQGLVVLDTPGLNAIGAEPELTLSLLPSAHATVFILAADAGVTRSDLGVWREQLGPQALARFVVLNKIDTLADPLGGPAAVEAQIQAQCDETARVLGIGVERIFPLSARQALAARIAGDADGLAESRLPALEAGLGTQLLGQRREVLRQAALDGTRQLEALVARRLGDQRRQLAEQMLELRGLRGKSGGKLRSMLQRIELEAAEFEQCTARLQALRGVHAKQLKEALDELAADRLREAIDALRAEVAGSVLKLGARKAFLGLCKKLRAVLDAVQQRNDEICEMLAASFAKLNGEFGFSLALTDPPELRSFAAELDAIEQNYARYLGLTQSLRLGQASVMEQFRRMLLAKLRVVFESASAEIEMWNKSISAQIDAQLRERRRSFRHRRESLERVQAAASDLELRIVELEEHDGRLQVQGSRAQALLAALREAADAVPAAGDHTELVSIDPAPALEVVAGQSGSA